MVNTCIVQGGIVGTAKQNVTLHEFLKERARRQLWRHFIQMTRSHWEPRRHSHVCSPHFVSLDFINDVEYYGHRNESSARLLSQPFSHLNSRCRNTQSVGGRGG